MLLQELETQLLALTPTEKAEAIRLLTQSLNNSWPGVTKTPDLSRIPVWLLESFRREGSSDAEILQFYPHLNAENLVNVWTYADAHLEEIEQAICNNEED